jgi:hypothetical protein
VLKTLLDNSDEFADLNKLCLLDTETSIDVSRNFVAPPEKSALDFGWEDQNGLSPVYFVGQTSSDFLKDLLCTCKGKSSCSQDCACAEQNLTCTELCQCQGTDACCNPLTQTADEDSDDEINI